MSQPRLFVCNGTNVPTDDPLRKGRHVVTLATRGRNRNVNLNLENVANIFQQHLTARLEDLLEIATFVYVADNATQRSGAWRIGESLEPWERDLYFVIPVRDLSFWSDPEVNEIIVDTLNFLSDDTYQFDFRPMPTRIARAAYLEFGENAEWPFYDVDRVIMFSGGLDSLSGAIKTATVGQNLVLVSHRPVTTQGSRQRDLFDQLKAAYPNVKMMHIPVEVNKDSNLKGDYFQRTRSFLFSALGTAIASSVRAAGVRFFENGVVSLNLPVAGETVGARASRTTHPKALHLFAELYKRVLDRSFIVDNPYIYLTKMQVLQEIARHGQENLIKYSCSCAHQGYGQTRLSQHCGTCSQCIDRRFAILAAGLRDHDPALDYRTDVFCGSRKDGYEQNMAVNYVRHANSMNQMTMDQIGETFNMELNRAVGNMGGRRSEEAVKLVDLHKRHAESVCRVLAEQIKTEADNYVNGSLPATSLLRLVANGEHQRPSWSMFGGRIAEVLQNGLPTTCKKKKPKAEPELQQICDGLLKAADINLQREYPYNRWAWGATKPDWSSEPHRLWLELKYIRKTASAAVIAEAIAADITRYGDNGQRVQFLIYDPDHLIPSDTEFVGRIRRELVEVAIIR